MSDLGSPEVYRDGTLSTSTFNGYTEIVNKDIVAPSYAFNRKKLRDTSFFLQKRKAYYDALPLFLAEDFKEWSVTDFYEMNESVCDRDLTTHYILLTHKQSGLNKVIYRDGNCESSTDYYDLCGNTPPSSTDCVNNTCPCGSDKFFVTDFVKGTPRKIDDFNIQYGSITGVQENTSNGTVGLFYDEKIKSFPSVAIGDWVYVHGTTGNVGSAACGQARQVVGINKPDDDRDYYTLLLNAPWLGLDADSENSLSEMESSINTYRKELANKIANGNSVQIQEAKDKLDAQISLYNLQKEYGQTDNPTGDGAMYSIYPERGEVVMYASGNAITTIHSKQRYRDNTTGEPIGTIADKTTNCMGFDSNTCIYDISEFNNRIIMLGSSGSTISGGLSFNKFYFSADNVNYVGTDKRSQAVFRNFLVQFSKKGMNVIVYDQEGNSFSYPLNSNVGLFSEKSYVVFQNSLYIMGSDKRLYSCEIASLGQGSGYILNIVDQSQQIKGDLSLLNDGDEVSLHSDGKDLYIFINNKYNINDSNNVKTKILIYNRDYSRWIKHYIANFIISSIKGGYYLGDSLYVRLGYRDFDAYKTSELGNYYQSRVDALIGENEDGGNGQLTMFATKKLRWIKIMLGKGIYTDGSTKVVVDYATDGWARQFQTSKVEHIDWVNNNNKIYLGEDVEISPCVLSSLSDGTNVVRECKGVDKFELDQTSSPLCRKEDANYSDNSTCIGDKSYMLSDVYSLFVDLTDATESNLYRVRVISDGGDVMSFGGMIAGLTVSNVSQNDPDDSDKMNAEGCETEQEYVEYFGNQGQ